MALKRTSDLDAAATLNGTELVAVSQGGTTVKATVTDIVNTASGAVTSFNTRTGAVVPTSGDYTFNMIGSTPTTLAGYGITDGYTNADAQNAVIVSTITNGDTTHAPSGDAVHDALASKADTGDVPATTDDLAEGSTNLYFTGARVGASLAAGAGISLSTTSGVTTVTATGGGGGGSGTVTSVALTLPPDFTVTGSPVTGSGTLAGAWKAVGANKVLAGPSSGADAAPTFRALTAADVPGSGGDSITAVNEQTGTTYTLAVADVTKAVRCTNAAAVTLTIPTNASAALPLYCIIPVLQGGAGAVTIAGASGVTLESPNGAVTTAQGDFRTLFQRATDVWVVG